MQHEVQVRRRWFGFKYALSLRGRRVIVTRRLGSKTWMGFDPDRRNIGTWSGHLDDVLKRSSGYLITFALVGGPACQPKR